MKKRLWLISLALILVLGILAPAPVLADDGEAESTPFTATADVVVVDPGTSTQYGMRIVTRGEKIEGVFTSSTWEALQGASLRVRHNSSIKLSPDGTFQGRAWALIAVSFPGGGGLWGYYRATLTGKYTVVGDQLVVLWVTDQGNFRVAGRDGDEYVAASGDWVANLLLTEVAPDVWTLAGDANVAGEYRVIDDQLTDVLRRIRAAS